MQVMILSAARRTALAAGLLCGIFSVPAVSEDPATKSATEHAALAKASQNPVAKMISVPFENNFNGDFGPDNSKQNGIAKLSQRN